MTAVDHDAEYGADREQDRFDAWAYGEHRGPYDRGGPIGQCPRCGLFNYGMPHSCESVIAAAFRDQARRFGR